MAKIGIATPIAIQLLRPLLGPAASRLPEGLGHPVAVPVIYELVRRGHDVSIYTLDLTIGEPVRAMSGPLSVYVGPCRRERRMRDLMRAERDAVCDMVATDAPDLVHAFWTYEYALGALASGTPTLITAEDWAPAVLRHQTDLYRAGRLLLYAATLRRGGRFTAVSPYIHKWLRRSTTAPVALVPNSLDDEFFVTRPPHDLVEAPIIVSINNEFGHRKNVQALLAAFPLIRRSIPGCRLRLIGNGYGPQGPAQHWALQKGQADGVEFVGSLTHDAVLHELDAAHLLIHPALEEAFGMVLLEAMARKVPVIGGRGCGAVPWVLDAGRAGILADVRRPGAVAAEAVRLLTSPEEHYATAEAGYTHAYRRFRASTVTDRYLEEYEGLTTAASRSQPPRRQRSLQRA